MTSDSTQRFTDRVADYVKYRPSYPREVVTFLRTVCGIAEDARVADIGAGTGISAQLFLNAGHAVVAVEPNQAMRAAADGWLNDYSGYSSVHGTAEATTLQSGSIDLVIAAQAFHWFDPTAARREFARILKPRGLIALFWNSRSLDGTPFLAGYEALLQRFSDDYQAVAERYADDESMAAWFGEGHAHNARFPNVQRLDFDGLRGRLMSSSYAPKAGHPNHEPMLAALRALFDRTAQDGTVEFVYETRVYAGRAQDGS
ncbi:class I SAM-dependent methyltransferase [Paraburkholderia sp. LEh10]|uniref:class I SAM-dependent methyltransferase n=1 Tax=Paraburkholderia sp. LEh10 TaxID=2821353 RepID=UPI001AE58466|nr:class I SAM-dependent methyltransferase [Paraburkholderia sp. LEh10]MBP0589867.1 class I SAM-dependent methyltransferase [Paraburkholderia sp. LEh10]